MRGNSLFMFSQAWELFVRTWKRRIRIRHVSLACSTVPVRTDQSFLPVQGDLFQAPDKDQKDKIRLVQRAAIQVKERFGVGAITLGAALNMPGDSVSP